MNKTIHQPVDYSNESQVQWHSQELWCPHHAAPQQKFVFTSIIQHRNPDTRPTVPGLIWLAGDSGGLDENGFENWKKLADHESEVAFQRSDLNLNNRRVELIGYVRKN